MAVPILNVVVPTSLILYSVGVVVQTVAISMSIVYCSFKSVVILINNFCLAFLMAFTIVSIINRSILVLIDAESFFHEPLKDTLGSISIKILDRRFSSQKIVLKSTRDHSPVGIPYNSLPIFLAFVKVSFIHISVGIEVFAEAFFRPFEEVSLVDIAAKLKVVGTDPIFTVIEPVAHIPIAIGVDVLSLATLDSFDDLTFVFFPIGKQVDAISLECIVLPFSSIDIPFGIVVYSFALTLLSVGRHLPNVLRVVRIPLFFHARQKVLCAGLVNYLLLDHVEVDQVLLPLRRREALKLRAAVLLGYSGLAWAARAGASEHLNTPFAAVEKTLDLLVSVFRGHSRAAHSGPIVLLDNIVQGSLVSIQKSFDEPHNLFGVDPLQLLEPLHEDIVAEHDPIATAEGVVPVLAGERAHIESQQAEALEVPLDPVGHPVALLVLPGQLLELLRRQIVPLHANVQALDLYHCVDSVVRVEQLIAHIQHVLILFEDVGRLDVQMVQLQLRQILKGIHHVLDEGQKGLLGQGLPMHRARPNRLLKSIVVVLVYQVQGVRWGVHSVPHQVHQERTGVQCQQ